MTREELEDLLDTFHYRLVVDNEPAAAVVGIAHLLERVPQWLDELVADEPPLRFGQRRIIREEWRDAAGALETAGERMFRQLELIP